MRSSPGARSSFEAGAEECKPLSFLPVRAVPLGPGWAAHIVPSRVLPMTVGLFDRFEDFDRRLSELRSFL